MGTRRALAQADYSRPVGRLGAKLITGTMLSSDRKNGSNALSGTPVRHRPAAKDAASARTILHRGRKALTGPTVHVVLLADEAIPIQNVQLLAGVESLLADGTAEAVDVEHFVAGASNQIVLINQSVAAGALRAEPSAIETERGGGYSSIH